MTEQWIAHIRQLEEKMFADLLDPKDAMRMKSDEYSWLYRPSHHFESGLITKEDVVLLAKPGKSLLSVGAYPGYLETLLLEFGVPKEHIVIADSDSRILEDAAGMAAPKKFRFDMHNVWRVEGKFDRIIFPESLCIALADKMKEEGILPDPKNPSATDAREAELLSNVIKQALDHLKPNGILRANGPMSHPNVVKLVQKTISCEMRYERFLLIVMAK